MELPVFSLIIQLVAALATLARALLADGMRFMALLARSRTALAAENLFLRKQLAFYQERKIKPRRFDNVTRFMLVLLSHGFAWNDARMNVTPKTFIQVYRVPESVDFSGLKSVAVWCKTFGQLITSADLRVVGKEGKSDRQSQP